MCTWWELDDVVLRDKAFVEANPGYDPFLTPMYVGMTGLKPKERFKNHKRVTRLTSTLRNMGYTFFHESMSVITL